MFKNCSAHGARVLNFAFKNLELIRGEPAALGRGMRWAHSLFLKNIKGKIMNFLH